MVALDDALISFFGLTLDHPHSCYFISSFKTEYSLPTIEILSFILLSSALMFLHIILQTNYRHIGPTRHPLLFYLPTHPSRLLRSPSLHQSPPPHVHHLRRPSLSRRPSSSTFLSCPSSAATGPPTLAQHRRGAPPPPSPPSL